MKERPILFSAPMVRAILEGRKTQTRRTKDKNAKVGDRFWVKETFAPNRDHPHETIYRANRGGDYQDTTPGFKWKPSIFMPRDRSRITLEVTAVRVQRLQEISEEDAIAEGLHQDGNGLWTWGDYPSGSNNPVYAYELLWDSINGKAAAWESNPWVWVYTFKRI